MTIERYLETQAISIVILGDFNPAIIQPYWLSLKGLIREGEANDAKIDVIHNEIIRYNIGNWLDIEVTKQRFELNTKQIPYFAPLRDLSIGIFKFLRETPVKAIGINHVFELKLDSSSKYKKFGEALTYLDIWEDSIKNPKLLQIEIFEEKRKDGLKGYYRIRITPSEHSLNYGVAININDHYDLDYNEGDGALKVLKCLQENWDNSSIRANLVVENLLNKIQL